MRIIASLSAQGRQLIRTTSTFNKVEKLEKGNFVFFHDAERTISVEPKMIQINLSVRSLPLNVSKCLPQLQLAA